MGVWLVKAFLFLISGGNGWRTFAVYRRQVMNKEMNFTGPKGSGRMDRF